MGQAHDLALPEDLEDWVIDGLSRLLVDQAQHIVQRSALGLRGAPPGEGLGHGIHHRDAPPLVGGDDAVADAGQGHRQAGLGLLAGPGRHLRGVPGRLLALALARGHG